MVGGVEATVYHAPDSVTSGKISDRGWDGNKCLSEAGSCNHYKQNTICSPHTARGIIGVRTVSTVSKESDDCPHLPEWFTMVLHGIPTGRYENPNVRTG